MAVVRTNFREKKFDDQRALYVELVDYEEMFHVESAAERPLLLNDFDIRRTEEKERLNRVLMTKYESDSLSVVPMCDCGAVKGQKYIGKSCDICGHKVAYITERELKPSMWLEAPEGIPGFIHPHVWTLLYNALGTTNNNVLLYLTDPTYRYSNISPALKKVMQLGLKRGLANFIQNFDEIIRILFESPRILTGKKTKPALWAYIQKHRHLIFTRYLPVPSKLTFITEVNAGMTFTDKTIMLALDAVRTLTSITTSVIPVGKAAVEARTVKANSLLARYYHTFVATTGQKPAIIRQHIVGTRPHFTMRAVISSITEPHDHRELIIPWGAAVQLYEVKLENLMLKLGMSPNEILSVLNSSVQTFNPLISDLFDILLYTGDGLWMTLGRNPSLTRGAVQMFRVGEIRRDPKINTIGLPILVVRAFNADFDRFLSLSLSLVTMIENFFNCWNRLLTAYKKHNSRP